ncbi:NAD(P)-dependent oxidoreductase [Sphingomonas sp. NSE70-1]|uniref:NAD(P)-dependent oxidoreductase n=1 Tax=Sphingomonas caseinilyticus TaxID=2908205 RepID=A0ABT0RRB0_9SPHN|nr:NAD(P)-dependent oxidoreductase [Sphingomonas caseinilyticus]MCL6697454.1 NAD(P)-dependent oxidoreductase [Sphingomonas caseinilyticus]
MHVLVTGAAGLIGSGVAARLREDHDVTGLDLVAGEQVQVIGDCFDVADWRHRAGKIDAVVHVAALHAPHVGQRSEADFRQANVKATSRLLDFAVGAGACSFVLTSTTSLYGHALMPSGGAVWIDEQLQPQPRDIYDETKLLAEELVASASNALNVTSLRMSRCFPEPADVMAWYRLHRGIDRRDVAEAHALALSRKGPAATYVISAATPFHRDDCGDLSLDAPSAIERRCPGLIARTAQQGWMPPNSIDRVYDASLAARELGFAPRFGIEACLAADWDPLPSA